MRRLRVGIAELLANSPPKNMYSRIMRVNSSSIMPQVLAVWLEELGHDVFMTHYSGHQNLFEELPDDLDIVFFSSFTTSAQVAYALSNYFRSKGIVTAIGGPHARSYPEDSAKYFDYVLGLTLKETIRDVLADLEPHPDEGVQLSALHQPKDLPGVAERWKYIQKLHTKARFLKAVPMIGSLGCPYTCNFCIDSLVDYQPLSFERLKDDLRFLRKNMKRPIVGWHDPNFGIRFNDYMEAMEEAVPPGSVKSIAESSLSLLSEKNVQRMQKNGIRVMLPGIETWFDLGGKSKMRKVIGMEKVDRVAEQVNMIMNYLPYVQANFVIGLDSDEGTAPFELTKAFVDKCPGVFPTYNLLTAYGRNVPLNLEYQRADRMLATPFQMLNNDSASNVRPLNYDWVEFYRNLRGLLEHTFSRKAVARRFRYNKGIGIRMMNYFRAYSQGTSHIQFYTTIIDKLENDRAFRSFFEQETTEVPEFYSNRIKHTLGPLAEWLPEGAIQHDPYAYLKSVEAAGSRSTELAEA